MGIPANSREKGSKEYDLRLQNRLGLRRVHICIDFN
jgi:hypothetical protein